MKSISIATAIIALTGCQSMSIDKPSDMPIEHDDQAQQCAIYDTRDWQASITTLTGSENNYVLKVSGLVDLPSPAYQVVWQKGPMDRANPPSLRLRLTTLNATEGASIQVITTAKIEYTLETPLPVMRNVMVSCGDSVVATIPVSIGSY
ncbi:hypothetical protein L3V77_05880 [Vibrio sp. DW001]|uniref:hypothetical protein n=1 Tax=Vibrio sp. DW001 TaxID=2912315 RepID=UPI0023B086FC|nr:hypothetical protein [Vibrio sp. DW001]WED27767.1 hypothetical protein L3V77_05880 [Vibrio sp. DW001]